MIEFLEKRIFTENNAIVNTFFGMAADCMDREFSIGRQAISIFMIYLFDLRHSGHYQLMAREVHQRYLRSKEFGTARQSVVSYAKHRVLEFSLKSYDALLNAWRTLLCATTEIKEESLLPDIARALSWLEKNVSESDLTQSENIARLIIQILTYPELELDLGVSLPEFMLDALLRFSPGLEDYKNRNIWIIFYEFFTHPIKASESLDDYRTRVTLACVLSQFSLFNNHSEAAQWILFAICKYQADGTKVLTSEFRESLRNLTQGQEYYTFLENPTVALRECRAKYPEAYYLMLAAKTEDQQRLSVKTKLIPAPSSIPQIRAYLPTAWSYAESHAYRATFVTQLSSLPATERSDLFRQLTEDEIAMLITKLASKDHVVLLTNCVDECLQIAECQPTVKSAVTKIPTAPDSMRNAVIHFVLRYCGLPRAHEFGGENPQQQRWVAEMDGEFEKMVATTKIVELKPMEEPHSRIALLKLFKTVLLRRIELDPFTIGGKGIPAHTMIYRELQFTLIRVTMHLTLEDKTVEGEKLGPVAPFMNPEQVAELTPLVGEISELLYFYGTAAFRQELLYYISVEIRRLTLMRQHEVCLALCEQFYRVITVDIPDESLGEAINRRLTGFAINDACDLYSYECARLKFLSWQFSLLRPEDDHREAALELTKFRTTQTVGSTKAPNDFDDFYADNAGYFQSQAQAHPEQYLQFLGRLSQCYKSLNLTLSPDRLIECMAEYFDILVARKKSIAPAFLEEAIQKNDPAQLLPLIRQLNPEALQVFIERFGKSAKTKISALFLNFSEGLLEKLAKALLKNQLHLEYFQCFIETHLTPHMTRHTDPPMQNAEPLDEAKFRKLAAFLRSFYQQALAKDQNPAADIKPYLAVLWDLVFRAMDEADFFDAYLYESVIHPMIELMLKNVTQANEEINLLLVNLLKGIVTRENFLVPDYAAHCNVKTRVDLFTVLLNPVLSYGLATKHWAELLGVMFDSGNFDIALALLAAMHERPELRAIGNPEFWQHSDPMVIAMERGANGALIQVMMDFGFSPQALLRVRDQIQSPGILFVLLDYQTQLHEAKDRRIAELEAENQALRPQAAPPAPTRRLSDAGSQTFSFQPGPQEEKSVEKGKGEKGVLPRRL